MVINNIDPIIHWSIQAGCNERKRRLPNVQKSEIPASANYYLAAHLQTGANPW